MASAGARGARGPGLDEARTEGEEIGTPAALPGYHLPSNDAVPLVGTPVALFGGLPDELPIATASALTTLAPGGFVLVNSEIVVWAEALGVTVLPGDTVAPDEAL